MSGGWVCCEGVLLFGRPGEARFAGPGGARDGGRVCAAGCVVGGGGAGVGIAREGVLCLCVCPLVAARLCGQL